MLVTSNQGEPRDSGDEVASEGGSIQTGDEGLEGRREAKEPWEEIMGQR